MLLAGEHAGGLPLQQFTEAHAKVPATRPWQFKEVPACGGRWASVSDDGSALQQLYGKLVGLQTKNK